MHDPLFPVEPAFFPAAAARPRWPAMLASLVVHVTVLALLAWLLANNIHRGTTESPAVRSVGLAIAHRMPDRTRYVTEPQEQAARISPSVSRSESESSAAAAAAGGAPAADHSVAIAPPIDLAAVLAEMTGSASGSGAGDGEGQATADSLVNGKVRLANGRSADDLQTSELVPGAARAGMGAGQTTTEVFGVSGTGSTFVYVFDRSESMTMAGSAPLRAAKTELIRSLKTLTERQQFQIIFYNDQPDVFRSQGDRVGLVMGESATIARACQYVQATVATGGTEHEPALRMALRLAPDVIFFLTDAKIQTMSEQQLGDITRRAENAGTTIHAIQFGTGPAPQNTFLEQLVRRGGGGYRYVDVTSLP